jgi:UDP-arabinose 4-epimerase
MLAPWPRGTTRRAPAAKPRGGRTINIHQPAGSYRIGRRDTRRSAAIMARTVLVTGGAGYVGAHCCKAFAEAGWEVVVYDNLSTGWRDFVRWGPLIEGDILDGPRLAATVAEVAPDAVAHFAALADVAESVAHPERYYRVNVGGTLSLLDAMRGAGVGRLVFSSTCATYGPPVRVPIDEDHPQAPINAYGWSKLFVERMLADHATAHGLRYAALRYFNAAGADLDGQIGERHDPEHHVIPLAIRGALSDSHVFTIHGHDYDTRDGTAIRDYVHVADLADAHCRALDHLMADGASEAINLGTGDGTSVAEIAAAVERAAGRAFPRTMGPRRVGDPAMLIAAAGKARAVLDWTPRHSSIEEIVSTAWRWHAQGG